jgi:hypothetical protein
MSPIVASSPIFIRTGACSSRWASSRARHESPGTARNCPDEVGIPSTSPVGSSLSAPRSHSDAPLRRSIRVRRRIPIRVPTRPLPAVARGSRRRRGRSFDRELRGRERAADDGAIFDQFDSRGGVARPIGATGEFPRGTQPADAAADDDDGPRLTRRCPTRRRPITS